MNEELIFDWGKWKWSEDVNLTKCISDFNKRKEKLKTKSYTCQTIIVKFEHLLIWIHKNTTHVILKIVNTNYKLMYM
jgi:hypothetical protein